MDDLTSITKERLPTMKIIARSLAMTLLLAGLISACHAGPSQASRLLECGTTPANMPIPVCPPNDPHACGIDKW
jgi:hypothetical protein